MWTVPNGYNLSDGDIKQASFAILWLKKSVVGSRYIKYSSFAKIFEKNYTKVDSEILISIHIFNSRSHN